MKSKSIIVFIFVLCSNRLFAQELSALEKHAIRSFVNDLQYGRKELVADAISYPIGRIYPLPPVEDEEEFIALYNEFFDDKLVDSISTGEWDRVGWRGIMCANGAIWGDIDDEGLFYVRSFNYKTKAEKDRCKAYIEEIRGRLYHQLRDFQTPELVIRTNKFTVRIDNMPDGSIRYASWSNNSPMTSKPDLVLSSGKHWTEGSMHVSYYEFTNGDYSYMISEYGNLDYDYTLTVQHNGETILEEYGTVIY